MLTRYVAAATLLAYIAGIGFGDQLYSSQLKMSAAIPNSK
jgi:hypothetical protein